MSNIREEVREQYNKIWDEYRDSMNGAAVPLVLGYMALYPDETGHQFFSGYPVDFVEKILALIDRVAEETRRDELKRFSDNIKYILEKHLWEDSKINEAEVVEEVRELKSKIDHLLTEHTNQKE